MGCDGRALRLLKSTTQLGLMKVGSGLCVKQQLCSCVQQRSPKPRLWAVYNWAPASMHIHMALVGPTQLDHGRQLCVIHARCWCAWHEK
jgi:hypothetical protein